MPAGSDERAPSPLSFVWNTPAVLMALTTAFWSGNIVVGRAVADLVHPVAFSQMRWSLALVLLLPFAWTHLRADWPIIRRSLPLLALLSGLGISLYNTLLYEGLRTTTAINGALLAATFPLVIAGVGFVLYRDRLTPAQGVGILGACAGAVVILTNGDPSVLASLAFTPGDVIIVGAQLAYATYTVTLRERPQIHPLSFLTVTVFFGQLLLMPASAVALHAGAHVTFDATMALAVLYVAVFPAIVSFLCFNRAVKLVGSNRVAPYFNLVPLFSVLLAIALLGERMTVWHALGWAMIVTGIFVAQRRTRRVT